MEKYIDDVFERYQQNAADFEEIFNKEDPQCRLKNYLLNNFDWDNKRVLEAGAGTGRVTDYYIEKAAKVTLTDGSEYMAEYLSKKYAYNPKVTCIKCQHEKLRQKVLGEYDIFLSAFSFGYPFKEKTVKNEDFDQMLENLLLDNCKRYIIVECVGTFNLYDNADEQFIRYIKVLNKKFVKNMIVTEFVFESNDEAVEAASTLFNLEIAKKARKSGSNRIPLMITVYYNDVIKNG